ncbi:TetR/AcrR family transcriptional regulator [Phytohabitans sp. ZYX-F-186]|uniref:TetR/AcrR family transcriptional regulator n=1 Tax=Phytohabitans maris TaxID=3071409 RepID=A0ABU0Z8R1_9ACTN|nr:TetR/AcrR family transcriptional regulator [Phytohabitans sp. ZYX-F-186]MDQ7903432.1 TetR/AcrR family transcriptional regulator [Phytohabitans sp. ZYX-F-186]
METATRRERLRAQTREEAKAAALRQIAAAGPHSLSLNAIGKELGMTGPALYRYFDGRDGLLTELISDGYHDLADAVEAAGEAAAGAEPADRIRALARAFRNWAIAQPHRYLLLFGTPVPGYQAPAHTIEAATRTLQAFLEPIAALGPGSRAAVLEEQLAAGLADRSPDHPWSGPVLRLGVSGWTRMHGVVSLEVEGHFGPMGFDPGLLFEAEIESLIEEAASS